MRSPSTSLPLSRQRSSLYSSKYMTALTTAAEENIAI
jgi:hypothetical protein